MMSSRARVILVGRRGGDKMPAHVQRTDEEAEEIAKGLYHQIAVQGADMAELATMLNDDPGGIERSGDLGWILRGVSSYGQVVRPVFLEPVGKLIGPVDTTAGWALVLREQ